MSALRRKGIAAYASGAGVTAPDGALVVTCGALPLGRAENKGRFLPIGLPGSTPGSKRAQDSLHSMLASYA